jgi:hypothetical protein
MAFTNNKIKQATGSVPAGCIGKDTMQLGVDQTVTFGPTSSTGFFNGIVPPTNGWTVYLTKTGSQGPSIYTTPDIVGSTKQISGNNSITTEAQALDWYFTQTDKIVTNKTFPSLRTESLRMAFDSSFPLCYNRISSAYDVSPTHHALQTSGSFDGPNQSSLTLNNASPNPASNTKNFVINQNFTFQTISIWVQTKTQAASDYRLFESGTAQYNVDASSGVGAGWNGNLFYENGVPSSTLNNINQVVKQNNVWYNFVIVLPSSFVLNKLSILSGLLDRGTDGLIGEVYAWADGLSDGEILAHFNEFCSRYNNC